MKLALFLFTLTVLFTSNIDAQTLAMTNLSSTEFPSYSSANFAAYGQRPKGTIALISVGSRSMYVGCLVFLYGALTSYGAYGRNTVGDN